MTIQEQIADFERRMKAAELHVRSRIVETDEREIVRFLLTIEALTMKDSFNQFAAMLQQGELALSDN